MHTKYLIETTCSGSKQFVRIQHPSTHRRRHRQPDACHDDAPPAPPRTDAVRTCHRHAGCLHVPVDEWNDLVRAERSLRKKNDKLTCEGRELRDSARRLSAENKALARKVKELREANEALRCEVERLGRDNDCMAVRIRELERSRRHSAAAGGQVDEYRRLARSWQDKFEGVQAVIDEKAGVIRGQRETIAMYERLLRRHGILAG